MEHLWAELPDARGAPIEVSLALLEALHRRWVLLLRSLGTADWELRYLHPSTAANGRSTKCWRCTPGTASTTPPMSPGFATGWDGSDRPPSIAIGIPANRICRRRTDRPTDIGATH